MPRGSYNAMATPLAVPDGSLTHVFPTAAALALADDDVLADAGAPAGDAAHALRGAARRPPRAGCRSRPAASAPRSAALPGIGPWTVEYVAMRALGDPDAFPAGDLGVLHGLRALGVDADAREAERRSQAWRPFRAYTVLHLWRVLHGGGMT